MSRKRKPLLPKGTSARTLPSGRITLQIRTDGKRPSQHSILPSEPESYATMEEACEGAARVQAYLALEVNRGQTVAGFAERWTDPDDPRWGVANMPQRGPETRVIYASSIAAFVRMYGDRPMASISDDDVRAYQRDPDGGYAPSQMKKISTFLRDAAKDNLRVGNPAQQITKEAVERLTFRRENNKPKAPSLAQIERALAHMRRHRDVYPRGFYGWFLTGARTGMRTGELDGMQFEFVEGDRYRVRYQLHGRRNELALPKWVHRPRDCRKVFLPADVLAEIRHQRKLRMSNGFENNDHIWLNTEHNPWRQSAREKWWEKRVGGTSLCEICGGIPIYNATRHHWATHTLNVVGMPPFQASILFGHKDGGALMVDRYTDRDFDSAVDLAVRMDAAAHAAIELEDRR